MSNACLKTNGLTFCEALPQHGKVFAKALGLIGFLFWTSFVREGTTTSIHSDSERFIGN